MIAKRFLQNKINKWIDTPKILILKGPRQVGKTTLLKKTQKDIEKKGYKTLYFSVDEYLYDKRFQDHQVLCDFLETKYFPHHSKRIFLFLDEFQYIEEAGLFLKVLFDKYKDRLQIIVSGSSSLEITKNSEFLTGRKIEFLLSPLTFKEFMIYKSTIYILDSRLDYDTQFSLTMTQDIELFHTVNQRELKNAFIEYMNYGGYPEVMIYAHDHEDKVTILDDIVETYVQKDIAQFLRVEHVGKFNHLITLLNHQAGQLVNFDNFTNTVNLNRQTFEKYIDILQGTYVIDIVRPFFSNIRKELSKMPKVFIHDQGMMNHYTKQALYQSFDEINPHAVENFVYLTLKNQHQISDIHFYRTISKSEIDFIIHHHKQYIPIEVKFRNKIPKHLPVSLKNFAKKYDVKHHIIITKDQLHYNKEENMYCIPLYLLPFIDIQSM